uniref:Mitochondrial import inner membrane translocase subunit n=1 Tax=Ixodes ricinus TaxID=34613 RepID=V5I1Y4_IXORI
MPFDSDDAGAGVDREMQAFLAVEQQKAQFQAQVHRLNEICWDKCVDKPSTKLDGRTETCLSNCVVALPSTPPSPSPTASRQLAFQRSSAGHM